MVEVYTMVKQGYDEEANVINNQLEALTSHHCPFLSFEKENLKQFEDLINSQQAMAKAYHRRR